MFPRYASRFTLQEVVNFLHSIHTGGSNASLGEFGKPLTPYARPGGDLALAQSGLIYKLICAFKKVHAPILAKCYPLCKENFTRRFCKNVRVWQKVTFTLQKDSPRFGTQRKSS